jgi:uncharacterized protein (DUF433 family)
MSARMLTPYRYIEIDEDGRAIIAGTRFKVYLLIAFWQANGWTPEELHENYPVLSLAQIHSAFAYYWDHKDDIERAIGETDRLEEEYRRATPEPPALDRLRNLKHQMQQR